MPLSKQLFTASDYYKLHSLVFQPDYPGYKPDVVEAPNGDGNVDELKRYAHVADKYLFNESPRDIEFIKQHGYHKDHDRDSILHSYLNLAHQLSLEVAISIGIPRPFWPVRKYGALRVLEYDGEATTAPHKDFDLFTLMLYRNDEQYFRYIEEKPTLDSILSLTNSDNTLKKAQELNTQIHFGEILEEIDPNSFRANKHEVVASGGAWQYSIVYFSIPDWNAVLPSGLTVGKWISDRIKRSRYER